MRKYFWIVAAVAGLYILRKRAEEMGSWADATESMKADLTEALANRNKPGQPTLWQRFFGSRKPAQEPPVKPV